MRFTGWRSDYLELLAAADILADSYPVGGGVLLMEAMALGLPVVSFDHDYVLPFSNDDCSGAREIVGMSDLIVPRRDFEGFRAASSELIRDDGHRARIGESCREHVIRHHGDPARMVRRCEDVFAAVFSARCVAAGERRATIRERDPQELERMLRDRAAALDRREAELETREAELETREAEVGRRVSSRVLRLTERAARKARRALGR